MLHIGHTCLSARAPLCVQSQRPASQHFGDASYLGPRLDGTLRDSSPIDVEWRHLSQPASQSSLLIKCTGCNLRIVHQPILLAECTCGIPQDFHHLRVYARSLLMRSPFRILWLLRFRYRVFLSTPTSPRTAEERECGNIRLHCPGIFHGRTIRYRSNLLRSRAVLNDTE